MVVRYLKPLNVRVHLLLHLSLGLIPSLSGPSPSPNPILAPTRLTSLPILLSQTLTLAARRRMAAVAWSILQQTRLQGF